jgi:hypothetical protein
MMSGITKDGELLLSHDRCFFGSFSVSCVPDVAESAVRGAAKRYCLLAMDSG